MYFDMPVPSKSVFGSPGKRACWLRASSGDLNNKEKAKPIAPLVLRFKWQVAADEPP